MKLSSRVNMFATSHTLREDPLISSSSNAAEVSAGGDDRTCATSARQSRETFPGLSLRKAHRFGVDSNAKICRSRNRGPDARNPEHSSVTRSTTACGCSARGGCDMALGRADPDRYRAASVWVIMCAKATDSAGHPARARRRDNSNSVACVSPRESNAANNRLMRNRMLGLWDSSAIMWKMFTSTACFEQKRTRSSIPDTRCWSTLPLKKNANKRIIGTSALNTNLARVSSGNACHTLPISMRRLSKI
mmetsp:Transcript_27210/g.71635  ORF Transcript_27210/g.71635 Transcript_27210/m.71635 type:complete len:248 (+) Transcript_27210:2036-2779(+)